MTSNDKLQAAVDYAKSFIGWKYVWGGEGAYSGGFDCSGLVLECLRSVGMWGSADSSAGGVFTHYASNGSIVDNPSKGCLLFFGESRTKITHVALALNDWQMIEAGGGDQSNTKGMVRIRPIGWRKDLVATLHL